MFSVRLLNWSWWPLLSLALLLPLTVLLLPQVVEFDRELAPKPSTQLNPPLARSKTDSQVQKRTIQKQKLMKERIVQNKQTLRQWIAYTGPNLEAAAIEAKKLGGASRDLYQRELQTLALVQRPYALSYKERTYAFFEKVLKTFRTLNLSERERGLADQMQQALLKRDAPNNFFIYSLYFGVAPLGGQIDFSADMALLIWRNFEPEPRCSQFLQQHPNFSTFLVKHPTFYDRFRDVVQGRNYRPQL